MQFRLSLLFFLFTANVLAQTEDTPVELTGTLAKVRAAGALTIAYRESSVPFSYLSARGEPIGYSIELCKKLGEAIGEAVGREIAFKWLAVTSETRIEAITSGKADVECGSTTNNLERQKLVAFSPVIFVAGTKLLVKRGSPVRSYRDLAGKTVVVTAGTTNENAMQEIARRFKLDVRLVTSKDHAQSYARLEASKADAFATDDVLLYGLLARTRHRSNTRWSVNSCPTTPTGSCSARATRSSPSWSSARSTISPRTGRSSASTSAGSCSGCPGRARRRRASTCR